MADHPCVTENIEGETGKNRMGKQRRPMNVAGITAPPHTPGNKHRSFPHKVLPTEEPLAVEAHVFIMLQAIRSCTTYCSYLERRFAGARVILLSFSARRKNSSLLPSAAANR